MTLVMPTFEGPKIDTGFWAGDMTKVQLGDLPPMTTQQFVGYAAVLLVNDIIPNYDEVTRKRWISSARELDENLKITPQIEITGKFIAQGKDELASQLYTVPSEDLDELIIALQAAASPIGEPEYYVNSPFVMTDEGSVSMVVEDKRHTTAPHHFHSLTHHVLSGGMMGWDHNGTYDEVRASAGQIYDALKK